MMHHADQVGICYWLFCLSKNTTTCIIYQTIIWFKHDFKAFIT